MSSDAWIPNCVPELTGREMGYLAETLAAGWIAAGGPVYRRFAEAFAAYVGAPEAVPVASGTAALHLALRVAGIGPGDSVFVPSLTFAASAAPAAYLGARVVPVDVAPPTWTLDAADLERAAAEERAAGRRPRAVVPVHLYALPADLPAILAVARREGLEVVEDAAEGLGTLVGGRHVGRDGRLGCFSFNANKLVTAAGGGMIVAGEPGLLARCAHLASQARADRVQFTHDEVGYNYRFSALHAAVGLAQLDVVEETISRKRAIFGFYREALGGCLEFVGEPAGVRSSRWLSNALLPAGHPLAAADAVGRARARGVEVRPWFTPLHRQPSWPHRPCPRAEEGWRRGLSLPSSPGLTPAELERVAAVVREVLAGGG